MSIDELTLEQLHHCPAVPKFVFLQKQHFVVITPVYPTNRQ